MRLIEDLFATRIIAKIFDKADKETRREFVNLQIALETNERDRVSALCTRIRSSVGRNPFISSFSVQAHARDTPQRDALFVFRLGGKVKIGLVETKLLRFKNNQLNYKWDWVINGTNRSHFTQQVKDQQEWVAQAAVWDMFIPDCHIGGYSPSLQREGSSNVWATELHQSPKMLRPTELWTLQDVLDAKDQYLSLAAIIKEILSSNNETLHDVNGHDSLIIKSTSGRQMSIPIPQRDRLSDKIMNGFFASNPGIAQFYYYRFDDLIQSVRDFIQTRELFIPDWVRKKDSYNEPAVEEYLSIVRSSIDNDTE